MKQIHKKHHPTAGFAHIGVIIAIVAVVAAIAFGGWYVWEKNKKEEPKQSANNSQAEQKQDSTQKKDQNANNKTFNCKDTFEVAYPEALLATTTDAGQCLISNVDTKKMPAVGPLPSEQLGLFFNIQSTEATATKDYLDDHIKRSQEDFPLELTSQQEIKLDNAGTATLAKVYGGHPTKYDFYFFVYIKNGLAITTSYPTNSNYTETALKILKSIQ